jgi:hypothetical protein
MSARWLNNQHIVHSEVLTPYAQSLADLQRADQRIKQLASAASFQNLSTKLIAAFRHAGEPRPVHNTLLFERSPLTEEREHNWRKMQVIDALLQPLIRLKEQASQERRATKEDTAQRRYHPHVECYRHYLEPQLDNFGGGELLSPDLFFDQPEIEQYYQGVSSAFDVFKKATTDSAFKKQVEAHRRRGYNAEKSLKAYVDALLTKHDGLEVIYLNLGHRTDLSPTPLRDIKKDLSTFLQTPTTGAFNHPLVGYIWKLERSISRGYHHHCFFFFKPGLADQGKALSDHLSQRWIMAFTEERGVVSQLDYRAKQNQLLLHPECPAIHRKGDATYQRLSTMLELLIHVDNITYLDLPTGFRSLGRGQLPKG